MSNYERCKEDYDAYLEALAEKNRVHPHVMNIVGQYTFHHLAALGLATLKSSEELYSNPTIRAKGKDDE